MQIQAHKVRSGLDLTVEFMLSDPPAAEGQLQKTLLLLTALEQYLKVKGEVK